MLSCTLELFWQSYFFHYLFSVNFKFWGISDVYSGYDSLFPLPNWFVPVRISVVPKVFLIFLHFSYHFSSVNLDLAYWHCEIYLVIVRRCIPSCTEVYCYVLYWGFQALVLRYLWINLDVWSHLYTNILDGIWKTSILL